MKLLYKDVFEKIIIEYENFLINKMIKKKKL